MIYVAVRVINVTTKYTEEDKTMTNKEAKRKVFLQAAARWRAAQVEEARRNSAKAAYKAGKITWNEYLKLAVNDAEYAED